MWDVNSAAAAGPRPGFRRQVTRRRDSAPGAGDYREAVRHYRDVLKLSRPVTLVSYEVDETPRFPVTGLGKLAILPNEVIMLILHRCTPCSLMHIMRANKAGHEMVENLPSWAFVMQVRNASRHEWLVEVASVVDSSQTGRGIMSRARPHYQTVLKLLLRVVSFDGLSVLLTSHICEECSKNGSALRMDMAKVLCESCFLARRMDAV
jgi:hypothetical protein